MPIYIMLTLWLEAGLHNICASRNTSQRNFKTTQLIVTSSRRTGKNTTYLLRTLFNFRPQINPQKCSTNSQLNISKETIKSMTVSDSQQKEKKKKNKSFQYQNKKDHQYWFHQVRSYNEHI